MQFLPERIGYKEKPKLLILVLCYEKLLNAGRISEGMAWPQFHIHEQRLILW